jgi:hypothetical protein
MATSGNTSPCFAKEEVPEDIEVRARAALTRVGVGILTLVDNTDHNGCLHCLRAMSVPPGGDTVPLWAPLLPCDRHTRIPKWLRPARTGAGVACAGLGVITCIGGGPILAAMSVTAGCTRHYIGRKLESLQIGKEWGVVHVHQDLFKKCQVMATRMQAAPVRTYYAETLGTHGKFLDDLGCSCKYVDTQQAVTHMVIASIAATAPSLVLPAKPQKAAKAVVATPTPPGPTDPPRGKPIWQWYRGMPYRYRPILLQARIVAPPQPSAPPALPPLAIAAPAAPAEVSPASASSAPQEPPAPPPEAIAADFLPCGTGIMGYMCPEEGLEGVATNVRVGELLTKSPPQDASKIEAREALVERLHTIAQTCGVVHCDQVMREEGITPQARVCGPVRPGQLPKIAGPHSTCEKRAFGMRHFAEDPVAGVVKEFMVADIREHVQMFIAFVKTGMLVTPNAAEMHGKKPAKTAPANAADMTFLDWGDMMSKSWVKNDGWKVLEKVFTECIWVDGTKQERSKNELKKLRSLKRSFFVKLNEAIAKTKPRLIQQCGKDGSACHIADAGILERILFGLAFLEMRSIKHATPKQLRKRFADFLNRFMSGYAMSGDYGKYDSCMKAKIRGEVENTVVWEILQAFNPGSGVADRALGDRLKDQLKSMSAHHWLSTYNAGRESGDRGTSVLNYVTNLIIFTVTVARETQFRQELKGASKHDARLRGLNTIKSWYQGDAVGFDWMGEGDDNLHLYAKSYVNEAPGADSNAKRTGIATRMVQVARDLGFYLEPQGVEGEAPLEEALVPVTQRVEFTSKVLVPFRPSNGQLYVSLLPKVKKTIIGSQVTFCTDDRIGHPTASFMKYLGMMHACIDAPPLFEYAAMFARYFERQGGGCGGSSSSSGSSSPSLEALSTYDSQRLCESYGADVGSWCVKLREMQTAAMNADGQTTAMQKAIEGEAPRLLGHLQEVAVLRLREENGSFEECCLTAQDALLQYIF